MKKCPNGMYAEIKYDGERLQLHKKADQFHFYSRSLKPVQEHKVFSCSASLLISIVQWVFQVTNVRDFVVKAFPDGGDLILDSEVLLIDTKTGKPLPFGTLGLHKKQAFQDANVCLFVFDCLMYQGKSLLQR